MSYYRAKYYSKLHDQVVKCELCPHGCVLQSGKVGICRVRKNIDGELIATSYGMLSAINLDPIEKKPLYHFFPSKQILSIGSVGCNMHCTCCQNYSISQTGVEEYSHLIPKKKKDIIQLAKNSPNNIGLAFTYNEPTIWFEYMIDLAREAKKNKLYCVLVSNGFINQKPLSELLNYLDACNIDIKASNEKIYKSFTGASFERIKNNLKLIREKDKTLELTYLLIPEVNDDPGNFKLLIDWIYNELGEDTVLHISRYFPRYKSTSPNTPIEKLKEFVNIANNSLNYVYLGNIFGENYSDTICPGCRKKLILRTGFSSEIIHLGGDGSCLNCKRKIPIVN